jgi:hypothetical protein
MHRRAVDMDVRIKRPQVIGRGLDLQATDVGVAIDDLPLQV